MHTIGSLRPPRKGAPLIIVRKMGEPGQRTPPGQLTKGVSVGKGRLGPLSPSSAHPGARPDTRAGEQAGRLCSSPLGRPGRCVLLIPPAHRQENQGPSLLPQLPGMVPLIPAPCPASSHSPPKLHPQGCKESVFLQQGPMLGWVGRARWPISLSDWEELRRTERNDVEQGR